jgi:hypothetical protein
METMRMVRFMIFQFSTATDWHLMKASFESAVRLVRRSDLCCLERPRGTGNTVCICTLCCKITISTALKALKLMFSWLIEIVFDIRRNPFLLSLF